MIEESDRLKQYLLGTLSEPETAEIDLRIIEDESFSAEVSLTESELMEDYLDGSLSDDEFKLFEANFLTSPERESQLQEILLLRDYARKSKKAEKRAATAGDSPRTFGDFFRMYFRPLMAGGAVVAALLLVAVIWQVYFGGAATPLEREYAELNKGDLSNPASVSGFSPVNLSSGSFRDANSAVKQSSEKLTETVLFRLALPAGSEGTTAFIAKISRGSALIFTLNDLHSYQNPNGKEVRILVPRSILQKGQYQIRLENGAPPVTYAVSIE